MTTFWLKIIAMATMVIDHAAIVFFDDALWLRVIGRFAFLIYAFLIAEGFRHYRDEPKRVRKHFIRMALVMVVSEFACDYFDKQTWVVWSEQSVIPTLFLGLAGLWITERLRAKSVAEYGTGSDPEAARPPLKGGTVALFLLVWAVLAWLSFAINSQYRIAGVLLILAFYVYRDQAEREELGLFERLIHYFALMAAFVILHVVSEFGPATALRIFLLSKTIWPLTLGMLATAVPLALYNGRPGYKNRVLNELYGWFYPLQFFAMIAIRALL